MYTKKIYDENGKGFVRIFSDDIVEKVNPIEYYTTYELEKRATVIRDLLVSKNPFVSSLLDDTFFITKAQETLEGFFEQFEKNPVQKSFLKLLETERKKRPRSIIKRSKF